VYGRRSHSVDDTCFFFFFASVAVFIPFFLRAGTARFASLDFLATFNLPIGSVKTRRHTAAAYLNFAHHLIDSAIIIPSIAATFRAVCGLTNINWSEIAAV
jgi:intergrase/recombinase